jgi:leader peptidase (prepilin peptidase)/N-methyltransferase
VQYPLVEALTGALFVVIMARFGISWTLPAELSFVAGLVALSACDVTTLRLPNRIMYPVGGLVCFWLILATSMVGSWHRLVVAGLCGAVAFGAFLSLNLINPAWMGFGDVRLAAVIGVALGWLGPRCVLDGILVANVLGVVIAIALMATHRASRQTKVPYGLFLSIGAVVALGAGPWA